MGNKNSGRRKLTDEYVKHQAINKAWRIILKELTDKDNAKLNKQITIAKDIVVKDITTRISTSNKDTKIILIKPNSTQELNPLRILRNDETPQDIVSILKPDKEEGTCA